MPARPSSKGASRGSAWWPRRKLEGHNPLDLPETGHLVSWIRENLGSAGITETERQAMKDVVARHEARQAERIRPDRGISWKF